MYRLALSSPPPVYFFSFRPFIPFPPLPSTIYADFQDAKRRSSYSNLWEADQAGLGRRHWSFHDSKLHRELDKMIFFYPSFLLFFLKKTTIIGMALRVTSAYSSIVIHAARSWSAWSAWSGCDLQLEGERRGEDIVDWRAICHDLSLSLLLTLTLSSYDWASCWCADGIRERFCRGTHSCNESQGWDARVSADIYVYVFHVS